MKMTSWIYCSFQFEGLHHWKDAINEKDVDFLAFKHRHMFHVKLSLPVSHHDRDIEFIKLKNYLLEVVTDWPRNLHTSSCEDIAYKLAVVSQCFVNKISKDQMYFMYPQVRMPWSRKVIELDLEHYTEVKVEVSEDGENGAYLEIDFKG